MEKIIKVFRGVVKGIDEKAHTVTAIVSGEKLDRYREVILNTAWKKRLKSFKDHPTLLSCHTYSNLLKQIGEVPGLKNAQEGLEAKLQYYAEMGNAEADWGWKLAMKGKAAYSVGFLPHGFIEKGDEKYDEAVASLRERDVLAKEEEPRRIYTDVELLEISHVLVPAYAEALQKDMEGEDPVLSAVAKEICEDGDLECLIRAGEIVTKPEETEDWIHIPVKGEEGKHDDHKIRTIQVSVKLGIKALYCVDCKKIIQYMFDKSCKSETNKCDWTMEEAQQWMKEHGKALEQWEAALEEALEAGSDTYALIEAIEDEGVDKGVIPHKEYPTAPEGTPWNGPKEVTAADVKDLKIMCAWFDSENPDVKASYKLPHHRQADKHVVWNGVRAAMAALLGARGGVKIPEGDRKGVYNHLVKEYKRFDKEPPEFKDYTEEELRELFPEEHSDKHGDRKAAGPASVWEEILDEIHAVKTKLNEQNEALKSLAEEMAQLRELQAASLAKQANADASLGDERGEDSYLTAIFQGVERVNRALKEKSGA